MSSRPLVAKGEVSAGSLVFVSQQLMRVFGIAPEGQLLVGTPHAKGAQWWVPGDLEWDPAERANFFRPRNGDVAARGMSELLLGGLGRRCMYALQLCTLSEGCDLTTPVRLLERLEATPYRLDVGRGKLYTSAEVVMSEVNKSALACPHAGARIKREVYSGS